MFMKTTPKSLRLQIGLFGRTNVGKSSFLNYVAGQDVAITSSVPGTTTDVVEKSMELLPVGPVVFLDTAGIDDTSVLSSLRVKKTHTIFDRADVIVLIIEPNVWTEYEDKIVHEARTRAIPYIVVINKIDLSVPAEDFRVQLRRRTSNILECSCVDGSNRDRFVHSFKDLLIASRSEDTLNPKGLLGDLFRPCAIVALIVPIDLEAPKGRIILPQVQAIRDVLDNHAAAVVVKESEYSRVMQQLKAKPDLVVCDSQAVAQMTSQTPLDVPCTTFSIVFTRFKGDLIKAASAAAVIDRLRPHDRVLIAEACSHHAIEDDIGRVKIPRWLRAYKKFDVAIDVCSGRDYPEDLSKYSLIIHCGACMITKREMHSRLARAGAMNVPVTNYGVCIAFCEGVLERVLSPFPEALQAFQSARDSIREKGNVSHA